LLVSTSIFFVPFPKSKIGYNWTLDSKIFGWFDFKGGEHASMFWFPPSVGSKGGSCWNKTLKSFVGRSLKKYWIFYAPYVRKLVDMIFTTLRAFAPQEHPRLATQMMPSWGSLEQLTTCCKVRNKRWIAKAYIHEFNA
jgi:hypothetical protein